MLTHQLQVPSNPARVTIMGAGGFLGGAIAKRLEADGIAVQRIARQDIDLRTTNAGDMLAALLRPGDVFVAVSAIAPCKTSAMLRDNMVLTAAMLSGLNKSPVAQVINISSDAVYSDCAQPLSEKSPTAPDNSHGVMHLAREILFRQELKQPLAILRPTLVYGARDPHNGYGPNKFRRLANAGEAITLFGKGEEQRDHVYVDDIAEIVARVIGLRSVGVLNIATGTVTSFRAIADQVVTLSGNTAAINETLRHGPLPHNGYRAFSPANTYAAFPDFTYTPLSEGLARAQQEEFGNGANSFTRIAS